MKYQMKSPRPRWAELEQDQGLRKKIAERLYRHLAEGYSEKCFEELSQGMMEKCFQEWPNEFVRDEYDAAQRKGMRMWEEIGRKQASGACQGNSRTWFYNMSNRYGWSEKANIAHEHSGGVTVNVVNYSDMKPT